jgi:hypothetical protein
MLIATPNRGTKKEEEEKKLELHSRQEMNFSSV